MKIKSAFLNRFFPVVPQKDAAYYAESRNQKLNVFLKLQEDLKTDNDEIQTIILKKLDQIKEIKHIVSLLEKTKTENNITLSQVSKFVF
jgi:hypothetical protein